MNDFYIRIRTVENQSRGPLILSELNLRYLLIFKASFINRDGDRSFWFTLVCYAFPTTTALIPTHSINIIFPTFDINWLSLSSKFCALLSYALLLPFVSLWSFYLSALARSHISQVKSALQGMDHPAWRHYVKSKSTLLRQAYV